MVKEGGGGAGGGGGGRGGHGTTTVLSINEWSIPHLASDFQ